MSPKNIIPLSELEVDCEATVVSFAGGGVFHERIISMGLNAGSLVKVLKRGYGHGPLLLATGETRMALGRGMAEKVMVTPFCNESDE